MLWDALPSALDLARFQFAFTVTFHFLFPAFTIGLASYLAVLEGLWLWTGREAYLDLFRYWLKVFAVNFAMGVVSGIVLSYQFGTNWAAWADRVGPVLGRLLHRAGRALHAGELVGDRLQPLLPLPLPAHHHRRLPHHRDDRRRGRRLAPAARPLERAGADHVQHGDVDGGRRRAGAGAV